MAGDLQIAAVVSSSTLSSADTLVFADDFADEIHPSVEGMAAFSAACAAAAAPVLGADERGKAK